MATSSDFFSPELEMCRIRDVLSLVDFPGYAFEVVQLDDHFALRAVYCEKDIDSAMNAVQLGRLWAFPAGQAAGQLVQTAFKAVLTSLEHRAREHFLFRGAQVMQPHLDLELLAGLLLQKRVHRDPISFGDTP